MAKADPRIAIAGTALVAVGLAGWITSEAGSASPPGGADVPTKVSHDQPLTPH